MKKQRKDGSLNKTNVFVTQFQLKSTQLQKEERHKKFTTTFSHFKQHLLNEDLKLKQRNQQSREKKPFIEQLKFISNFKQDDFKAPRSLSKRSHSKGHIEEDPKRKLQKLNNEIFEQFYQEIHIEKHKKKSSAYMWDMIVDKKYRRKASQNIVQQKIEKAALQKFKDAISKENQQHQNNVGEKNAENLYLLLKTGRTKTGKNRYENAESRLENEPKYKHITTQPNQKRQTVQKIELLNKPVVQKQIKETKTQNLRPPSAKRIPEANNDRLQAPQNVKKQEVKAAELKTIEKQNKQISTQKEVKNQNENIKRQQANNNLRNFQREQKAISKQKFSESQSESQSESSKEQQKRPDQTNPKKQERKQILEQLQRKTVPQLFKQTKEELKQQSKIVQKIKALQNMLKAQEHRPEIKQLTKNESDSQQNKKQRSIQPNKKQSSIQQNKKESGIQQNKKESGIQQNKKEGKSKKQLFADIPSAVVVDSVEKKNVQQKQKAHQKAKKAEQKTQIKENDIQKILTTKYQAQKPTNNANKAATLLAPPKLNLGNPPSNQTKQASNRANYGPTDVDETQIQQVQWTGKQKAQAKSAKKQTNEQTNKEVMNSPKKQISQKPEVKPKVQEKVPEQVQTQKESEQDTLDDALDDIIFFTQRMQDIGQYRVNSKDIYNDKSIDKQLIKAYKICSYYMAHQFLYLTKILLELLTSQNITRDYYTISNDQLIQLQKEGLLDNQIDNLNRNVEESKKLLKKCYEECKPYLQKGEQLLNLDGHTNYYKRCCSLLIKEFKKMLEMLNVKPESAAIQNRCCYIIQLFCVLKMFNSQNLKDFEEVEEISDPKAHIKAYQHFLIGS